MNKLDVLKAATSAIVGLGTKKIVGDIIRNNTNPQSIADTVTNSAASWTITGMIVEKTKSFTDSKIDEAAEFWNKNFKNA